MNRLEALAAGNAEFERRLRLVSATGWDRPTPCTEWDVRALANHVVGGNRRYVMLLRGASAADDYATRTDDHLGQDPVAAFVETAAQVLSEFQVHGAMTRVVHHPIGDKSGEELLDMRVFEVAVHAWDLAEAIRADTRLDAELVEHALTCTSHVEAGRQSGRFAPALDWEATSPQQRLLALAGRAG